jgi:glyoxylase-like metal-dependent hydrolase (beta-lactamase superfamily II)
VIDVGFEPEPLLNFIQEHRLKTEAVMLTHAHADHIGGLEELRRRLDRPSVWIHPAEAEHLGDPWRNLSAFMGSEVTAQPAEASLGDGQSLSLGPLSFEIRHTPGHSPGGISLYQAESRLALVGDTLFAGGIGRSDFPESDPATLQASIRQRLLSLPDEVTVYPGHGPPTTIGRERQSNPFLQAES